MEAWKALGRWLSKHVAVITPVCVVAAVLLPDQIGVLKPLVKPLFALITFQSSLSNTFSNLGRTVRHPAPMLVSLALSAVVLPVLACVLGSLAFGDEPDLVCGIVLEYCVPMAVTAAMWTGVFNGNISLCLACVLVSTVAAPFTIPLTLQLLLGATVEVDALGMMGSMLVTVAIPALAGTAANDASRGEAAKRVAQVLQPASRIAFVLVILSNSTSVAPYLRALTPRLVAVAAFILAFSVFGYVLGLVVALAWRRPREDLVTMTFLAGMRNISAGAVLAAAYFPDAVMFPVVIGTLFQQVLAACFGTFMERVVLPLLDGRSS